MVVGAAPERNLRLVLEYDGTDFAGWQRQSPRAPGRAGPRTVQEVLEQAIEALTGAPATVRGAGRTDAGVHARAQVASFQTRTTIPTDGLRRGLNAGLPHDVAVTAVEEVAADFEPRRAARGKHYAYRIWNHETRAPLERRTSWHVRRPLDRAAMAGAAAALLGDHDFSAFRAVGCDAKSPVRVLVRLDVSADGSLVTIDAEATAFLRNMVRILAGTLVEVGLGIRPAADMAATLASRDRTRAGRTAPAHGLTLMRVFYPV